MLSTAILEAAHARILDPRLTSCNIISITVVVFPVPGGPWSKNTSLQERDFKTASLCKINLKKTSSLVEKMTN